MALTSNFITWAILARMIITPVYHAAGSERFPSPDALLFPSGWENCIAVIEYAPWTAVFFLGYLASMIWLIASWLALVYKAITLLKERVKGAQGAVTGVTVATVVKDSDV